LANQETEEEREQEAMVLNVKQKMRDFPLIVSDHVYPSRVFRFFEELCHPDVLFYRARIDLTSNSIRLLGNASDFLTLHQQLIIFEEEPLITEVFLSSLDINQKGGILFEFSVVFDPQTIK